MTDMKILYHQKSIHGAGGIERILLQKAAWLAGEGDIDVAIAVTDSIPDGEDTFYPLPDGVRIIQLGIEYGSGEGLQFVKRVIRFFSKRRLHRKRLEALIAEEHPDVVISVYPTVSSFIPAIDDGSAKILEFHFCRPFRLLLARGGLMGLADRIRTLLDRRTASRFDRFVVLTEEDRGLWGEMKNIEVIPNGVDPPPIHATPSCSRTVVACGRLCRQKGFDLLLKAWATVKADPEFSEWRLRILGEGSERNNLESLAGELRIDDSVEMPGNTENVWSEYARSALMVTSSRYEGFSLAIAEGMASGLPIVSFSCPCGPSDLIDHGINGFLVKDGDTESLAENIATLIRNPDLRDSMGKKGRKKIAENFATAGIMQRWSALLRRMVAQSRDNR